MSTAVGRGGPDQGLAAMVIRPNPLTVVQRALTTPAEKPSRIMEHHEGVGGDLSRDVVHRIKAMIETVGKWRKDVIFPSCKQLSLLHERRKLHDRSTGSSTGLSARPSALPCQCVCTSSKASDLCLRPHVNEFSETCWASPFVSSGSNSLLELSFKFSIKKGGASDAPSEVAPATYTFGMANLVPRVGIQSGPSETNWFPIETTDYLGNLLATIDIASSDEAQRDAFVSKVTSVAPNLARWATSLLRGVLLSVSHPDVHLPEGATIVLIDAGSEERAHLLKETTSPEVAVLHSSIVILAFVNHQGPTEDKTDRGWITIQFIDCEGQYLLALATTRPPRCDPGHDRAKETYKNQNRASTVKVLSPPDADQGTISQIAIPWGANLSILWAASMGRPKDSGSVKLRKTVLKQVRAHVAQIGVGNAMLKDLHRALTFFHIESLTTLCVGSDDASRVFLPSCSTLMNVDVLCRIRRAGPASSSRLFVLRRATDGRGLALFLRKSHNDSVMIACDADLSVFLMNQFRKEDDEGCCLDFSVDPVEEGQPSARLEISLLRKLRGPVESIPGTPLPGQMVSDYFVKGFGSRSVRVATGTLTVSIDLRLDHRAMMIADRTAESGPVRCSALKTTCSMPIIEGSGKIVSTDSCNLVLSITTSAETCERVTDWIQTATSATRNEVLIVFGKPSERPRLDPVVMTLRLLVNMCQYVPLLKRFAYPPSPATDKDKAESDLDSSSRILSKVHPLYDIVQIEAPQDLPSMETDLWTNHTGTLFRLVMEPDQSRTLMATAGFVELAVFTLDWGEVVEIVKSLAIRLTARRSVNLLKRIEDLRKGNRKMTAEPKPSPALSLPPRRSPPPLPPPSSQRPDEPLPPSAPRASRSAVPSWQRVYSDKTVEWVNCFGEESCMKHGCTGTLFFDPLLGTVFCNKNVKHVFSLCVDSLGNDYTSQYTPSLLGDDCTHCGEKICTALGDNLPLAQEQAHRLFGLAFFGGADSVRVNLRKDETLSLSIECGGREAGVVVGSVVELRVGMTGTRTGNRMLLLRTESVSTTHRCRFRIIECKQSTLSTVTMVSVVQFRCYGHAVNAIPRNDDSQYFGKAYTYYCETHTRMIHPCKQCRERALLTEKAMDDPSVIEEGDGAIPEDFASYMCDHHLRELGRMMCGRGGSSFGHRNLVPKSVRKQAEMAFQHKRRSPVTFAPEAVSPSKWHAASFPADDSITIAGLESASAAAAASDLMGPPDFGADFGFDEEEDVVSLFCSD